MIAALLLAAAPVPTQPTQPTGKWTVEYHDSTCALSRSYGSGPDATLLALRPYPLGTRTEVFLFTPRASNRAGTAEIRLLPDGAPVKGRYERVEAPGGKQSAARLYFEDEALKSLATAQGVALKVGSDQHLLATPRVGSAMQALRACQVDLLKSWDVDPAELTDDRPGVRGNPGQYFGFNQYPDDARLANIGGRVVTLLSVGTDGRVSKCRVVQPAHPSLDARTCEIATTRLRFQPARNADGTPRAAHFVLPVRWTMD